MSNTPSDLSTRIQNYVAANSGCTTADVTSTFHLHRAHATELLRWLRDDGMLESRQVKTNTQSTVHKWYAKPIMVDWRIPDVEHAVTLYQCRRD